MLTITIYAEEAKEIADLVLALQNRQSGNEISESKVKEWVNEACNGVIQDLSHE